MRVSLPESLRARAIIGVALVGVAGAAIWFFAIRDSGGVPPAPRVGSDPDTRATRNVSKDPIVRRLSTSEQIRQVLLLGFEGEPGSVEEGLGGVLVRGVNGAGAAKGLQKGEVPPLVVAAQEGGIYRSFPDLPPETRQLDLGREGSADATRAWAEAGSSALAKAGFDLNLFPVADVASLDSALAGRAFSDDPAQVAKLTRAALSGCGEASFACAPLHFPGLGAASADTAQGPATVSADPELLSSRDLLPFRDAVRAKAPAMVVSLALYPSFDSVVPAALSTAISTDLLRGQLRFKGVAISDDLRSGAVRATYEVEEAAVEALAAGIDLIQISDPGDGAGAAKAIETALKDGTVSRDRLTEAAERVIELKRKLGLVD